MSTKRSRLPPGWGRSFVRHGVSAVGHTPVVEPTITICSFEISIVGDWKDLSLLQLIKGVEGRSGEKAAWTGSSYTFSPAARDAIEFVFRGKADFRNALETYDVFIEYVGACRSHQSVGTRAPRRVECPDCFGAGNHKLTLNTCRRCFGTGYISSHHNSLCMFCSGTGLGPAKGIPCHGCSGSGSQVDPYNNTTNTDAYASGWYNGGWNVRFPEAVLRAFFPEEPLPFDGDFYKALLSSSDLSRSYKQLARKFHPDLGGRVEMFHKLKEAYDVLRDPQRRKRYQAGLAFQEQVPKKEKEVLFRLPVTCGDVKVRGTWSAKESANSYWMDSYTGKDPAVPSNTLLTVSEILSWTPIVRDDGKVMVATWGDDINRRVPFTTSWEHQYDIEIKVEV